MQLGSTGWSASEIAILRSVLYASLFEYPLTLGELHASLLESALSELEIQRVYAGSARLRDAIEWRDGWFLPRGRAEWIEHRRRREARSRAFLERQRRLLKTVSALPFVRLVALSGSLAVLNADERADLDLFVVTKGAHAWSVTLAVVMLSKLLGRRRVVCLNFVVSDTELAVEQRDLFSANQIIHLRPVAGLDAYREFLDANPFVKRWYPNFDPDRAATFEVALGWAARWAKVAAEAALSLPSRAVEACSRNLYGWYLRCQAPSWTSPDQVRLLPQSLKLHTRSHRGRVGQRFEEVCDAAICAADVKSVPAPAQPSQTRRARTATPRAYVWP